MTSVKTPINLFNHLHRIHIRHTSKNGMRDFYIVANWKANYAHEQIIKTITHAGSCRIQLVLALPYPLLQQSNIPPNVHLCAQDCSYKPEGAFTGEVSASLLKRAHINWVILGHSERRHGLYREGDDIVHKKVLQAVGNDMRVILCVGETSSERDSDTHFEVVQKQLQILTRIDPSSKILIAYEPVWAIGTDKSASAGEINQMIHFIKRYCVSINKKFRVLYGGSINAKNIRSLVDRTDSDGFLVGKSSMNDDILTIIDVCAATERLE